MRCLAALTGAPRDNFCRQMPGGTGCGPRLICLLAVRDAPTMGTCSMHHTHSAHTWVAIAASRILDIPIFSSLPGLAGLGLMNSGVYVTMGFVDTA